MNIVSDDQFLNYVLFFQSIESTQGIPIMYATIMSLFNFSASSDLGIVAQVNAAHRSQFFILDVSPGLLQASSVDRNDNKSAEEVALYRQRHT